MQGERAAIPALLDILATGETMDGPKPTRGWKSAMNSPQLFTGAAILLGRFAEKRAVPSILKLIEKREECSPALAGYAIQALARIGDRSAIAAIKPYLQPYAPGAKPWRETNTDETYAVQAAAAHALAELGDRSGLPVLIGFLDSDRAVVRDYAQRLLEQITGRRFGKDSARWSNWIRGESTPAPR
jgi:HEAT repeat protein